MGFPLFPGIPGGVELLIVLLVLLVIVGPGILLVLLGVGLLGRGDDDRIAELEARIEELETERTDRVVEPEDGTEDEPDQRD